MYLKGLIELSKWATIKYTYSDFFKINKLKIIVIIIRKKT